MDEQERNQLYKIIDQMDGKIAELIYELSLHGVATSEHVRWLNQVRQSAPVRVVIEAETTNVPIYIGSGVN